MTIVEFLNARLAEDEAVARADFPVDFGVTDEDHDRFSAAVDLHKRQPHGSECAWRVGEGLEESCFCDYPARVLREVAAKRRIIAFALTYRESAEQETVASRKFIAEIMAETAEDALKPLALPYADHADYRAEWRP